MYFQSKLDYFVEFGACQQPFHSLLKNCSYRPGFNILIKWLHSATMEVQSSNNSRAKHFYESLKMMLTKEKEKHILANVFQNPRGNLTESFGSWAAYTFI
uniref:Uncharacterized protein n=1 Tax=Micrurus paraensis TaxID=1970185 RepID=A0A2D4KYX4_9SAUR